LGLPSTAGRRGAISCLLIMKLEEALAKLKALGNDKVRARNTKNGAGKNQ
jgi:hypothetical protein